MEHRLRILCYGDSLTAGLVRRRIGTSKKFRASYHPYARRLGSRLKEHVIEHVGLCGWTTEDLLEDANSKDTLSDGYPKHQDGPGLATILERARDRKQPYDAVVLLSGTNDLGQDEPKDCADIAQDIAKLHALCRNSGVVQTLALTIPHTDLDRKYEMKHGRADPTRAAVNNALRKMCTAEPTACLVDLEISTHRHKLELKFPEFDGVHFTADGYDSLGDIVADHLCNLFPGACVASFLANNDGELQTRLQEIQADDFLVKDKEGHIVDPFLHQIPDSSFPLHFFELKSASRAESTEAFVRKESRSRPGSFYYINTTTGETQLEPPAPWEKVESRRRPGFFYYYNPNSNERVREKPAL